MQKVNAGPFERALTCLGAGCLAIALVSRVQAAPLTAGSPILLPGTQQGFDFIRIDPAANRLLLGHEGNKTFDVFDIASGKLLKVIPTSTSQDATTDVKGGRYYVSGNDPARMVIVDSTKLAITGVVPVPADTDLIAFNPMTGLVYESNDTAGETWVIDPAAKQIVTTIKLNGSGVEDLAFDPEYKHLYQAVKGTNSVAVIDPATNKVLDHGRARLTRGSMALRSCRRATACWWPAPESWFVRPVSGKVTATAPIGARVDEMAYDPGLHRAYCSSRPGSDLGGRGGCRKTDPARRRAGRGWHRQYRR